MANTDKMSARKTCIGCDVQMKSLGTVIGVVQTSCHGKNIGVVVAEHNANSFDLFRWLDSG
jgi:hypothetical protein